jgi:hypothetical protein
MKKKQKIFMPPQAVRDSEETGTESITLDAVKKMYRSGGKIGMRWARRIMRQEGILKASTEGDVHLPVAIDLQLGPEIFAGFMSEPVDEVVAKFEKAGISASCAPFGEGTLACFADYYDGDAEPIAGSFPVEKVDNTGLIMVDDSKAKIKSIMRSVWHSKDTAGFNCYEIEEPGEVAIGISVDKLFLLKSTDSSAQSASIIKVDSDLGLVLGWSIISTIDGEMYFDKQGDHMPDQAVLEASTDFMIHSRVMGDMHVKDRTGEVAKDAGTVVFCWPMTAEIAKAFEIETSKTGLMIAVKPDNEEILAKFKDGTYTGFSIGGKVDPDHIEEVT